MNLGVLTAHSPGIPRLPDVCLPTNLKSYGTSIADLDVEIRG
jgi:hypothetical protein